MNAIFLPYAGISHLYASVKSRNPGPLDSGSLKNEADASPKAVSLTLDDKTRVSILKPQSLTIII